MKFKWLVALAVILAIVWVGGVAAGPSRPAGGDPDIWERAKPNNPSGAIKATVIQVSASVAMDVIVFKASVKQQVAKESSKNDGSRRLSIARRSSARR
jgi:hypothetical protein